MNKPSDSAMTFEAVLLGATKDKNGFVVKLVVHPSEIPDGLMRDYVGTRYQIAAVKIADNGQPEVKKKERVRDEVQHAAMLCGNPNFQRYMHEICPEFEENHPGAIKGMRKAIGVASRSELKDSERARRKFHELVHSYERWLGE